MSREITDTKPKFNTLPLIPEGTPTFVVSGPVKKIYGKKNNEFFVWPLQYKVNETISFGEVILMPNMLAPLLRVLACDEKEPEIFDWDTNDQEGKTFTATISHAPDKKDPTKIRVHMSNYESSDGIPF